MSLAESEKNSISYTYDPYEQNNKAFTDKLSPYLFIFSLMRE